VLTVDGVTCRYGRIEVLHGVSLNVARGEVVALVGSNGAGKTTLMRTISGILPAAAGSIAFAGEAIDRLPAHVRVARGLAQVPEARQVFAPLSVEDNLRLGAYSRRDGTPAVKQSMDEVFARFPRLAERRAQKAGTLSGGERQMLALGRALMAKPQLLMLDEPSLGLAPLITREIFRIIASLRELGVSILLIEQNARAALETADFGYVMETGEIVHSGPASSLIHDPRLIATYLGGH